MKFYRYVQVVLFVFAVCFSISASAFADSTGFNEFGAKEDIRFVEQLKALNEDEFKVFDVQDNVPLNKVWKINFNERVNAQKIEAVVLIRDGDLTPVTLSGFQTKQLQVKATYNLAGASDYELRIYLKNNKHYKIPFETVDDTRKADEVANTNLTLAAPLYLNEKIKGEFFGQTADYYKLTLKEPGELTFLSDDLNENLWTTVFTGTLYESQDVKYLQKETGKNVAIVYPGEYYVRVSSNRIDKYELETIFTPIAKLNPQLNHSLKMPLN